VQSYAREFIFEIVFSEMRFGIRKSLSDDNKTSEVCMNEVERCAEESASMSRMLVVQQVRLSPAAPKGATGRHAGDAGARAAR
jgi:hypothetical protein